ncbi:MAG: ERCC4 domain-containing protein [Desulfosalsimonas sp.]
MKIITDSREQAPYTFDRWQVEVERAGLPAGDYSLAGFMDRVAVERKSIDDLVNCLKEKERDRFERELAKLRVYELGAVIVEANLQDLAKGFYKSEMKPHAALQSVTAFYVRYGVPFLFCGNRAGAEYITYSLLAKFIYEIRKRFDMAQVASA